MAGDDRKARPYPLRLREVLRHYGFGGRWIPENLDKPDLPADRCIAETWEVCDRPGESNEILNGPLVGRTLHDALTLWDERLLGRDVAARCGKRFPLLIKFLDATHPLGEQAHQSDEQAAALGLQDPGKTEAWYMLDVEAGATIHCGNRPGVDRSALEEALAQDRSRECMAERAVRPNDAYLLYAGTMHYSGGGVRFYELMQNSDAIIGLKQRDLPPEERHAWARRQADLVHLEEDFDCHTRPVMLPQSWGRRGWVLACRYFALERLDLQSPARMALDGERFWALSAIEGALHLECAGDPVSLRRGQSALLPAALGEITLVPEGRCIVLKAYVPDLMRDVVAPLRAAGVADGDIAALGGRTRRNDLLPLLD